MLHFLLCLVLLPYVYGGSQCPQRSEIHPCICIDRPIGKSKFDTTLVCHGLNDGTSLLSIEPALEKMEINRFLLYDAYWKNELLRTLKDKEIPINILSSFRIEEIEIVDTGMSYFACPQEYNCRTSYVKKFTLINSTLPEQSPCGSNGLNINVWISCPGIAEEIVIDRGFPSDVTIKANFFPRIMPKLKILRMPRNRISRIERKTFSSENFPALQVLDLSRNVIRDGKNLFTSVLKLKYLDLSYNSLRTVPEFVYLPHLVTLNLTGNSFTTIVASEWTNLPVNLRNIDLSNMNLDCNCGITFLNSTFHVNTNLLGQCNSPALVKGKKLRRASRFLSERCDGDGNIGAKRKAPPKQ